MPTDLARFLQEYGVEGLLALVLWMLATGKVLVLRRELDRCEASCQELAERLREEVRRDRKSGAKGG